MTLREKTAMTREKGEAYKKSKEIQTLLAQKEQFDPKIAVAEKDLRQAVRIKNALSDKQASGDYFTDGILEDIESLRESVSQGKLNVSTAGSLASTSKSLAAEASKEWTGYIKGEIQGAKSIIGAVSAFLSDNREYTEMLSIENSIYSYSPGNKKAFEDIEAYKNQFNSLIRSLNISDKLFELLKKLNSEKTISLDEIDVESIRELKQSQFSSKIAIRIE